MTVLHYINKAWLTIYCKQMRDYLEDKKPSLLVVAKDSKELEEAWDLWAKITLEVFGGRVFEEEPACFGITERLVRYSMERKLPLKGFTDFLISHNIVTCLDENTPSSLSSKVIGELRNKLGFTGIIMTDDLAMDAVKEYVDNGKAATMAINAGNDMIITSDFMSMKNELINSVKSKEISEDTINKAVTRVIAWKYYSGLLK